MTITRASNGNAERKELEKLAEKGITEEEVQAVVAEYEGEQQKQIDAEESFRIEKEKYKKELTKQAFEEGAGGFKRST